jgi:hypothetical protein
MPQRVWKEPMTLAYIEWYKPFCSRDRDTQLLKVSPLTVMNEPKAEIIELGKILASCHLIPKLGAHIQNSWNRDNVLDICDNFLLNRYIDLYSFMWFK